MEHKQNTYENHSIVRKAQNHNGLEFAGDTQCWHPSPFCSGASEGFLRVTA